MSRAFRRYDWKIPSTRFQFEDELGFLAELLPFFQLLHPDAGLELPQEINYEEGFGYQDLWGGCPVTVDYAKMGSYELPGFYKKQKDGTFLQDPWVEGLGFTFEFEDASYVQNTSAHTWYAKDEQYIECRGRKGDDYRMEARGPQSLYDAIDALLQRE